LALAGIFLLSAALRLATTASRKFASRVVHVSVIYLPVVLAAAAQIIKMPR